MASIYIIGVDPGPMTGIVGILVRDGTLISPPDVVQCSADAVSRVLGGLTRGLVAPVLVATEAFVVGPRAARSATPRGGEAARFVLSITEEWARYVGRYIERRATDVKPWATDNRLMAAGLLHPCIGMPHARDAARHALFAAVRDAGLPDPLSARARSV